MALIDGVKTALRIKSNTFDGEELTPLIEACKIDLGMGGVRNISDNNALVLHAVVLFCKAHFGFDDNADKYAAAYERLKNAMAISTEYSTEPEQEPGAEPEPEESEAD